MASPTLEDFLTSERDIANKISRIPGDEYLIRNSRQSVTQEPQESGIKEEEFEDMFIDDFVLLEPDFSKYNTKANLDKERDRLHEQDSSCLIGKPGTKGERITLEDFEIRKVIDKGSFGKVFLVSCPKMGKMYAMKRINKDLLLQKKQVQNIKNEKEILF